MINSNLEEVYFGLEHIAKSIFPREGWHRQIMALMKTVYADASGHESDQPFLIVAGWVSSVGDWIDLESKWRPYLKKTLGVECFHATDFFSNLHRLGRPKSEAQEPSKVLNDLADLIEAHTYQSFCVSVSVKEYLDAKDQDSIHKWLGNAYAFAGRNLATLAKFWTREQVPMMEWPVRFVFEKGDEGQDELFRQMKRDDYPTPNFEPKCSAAGLEAGDLLAWLIREDLLIRRKAGDLSSLRDVFLRFLRRRGKYWIEFKDSSFQRMAEYMRLTPQEFETLDQFKRRERGERKGLNIKPLSLISRR